MVLGSIFSLFLITQWCFSEIDTLKEDDINDVILLKKNWDTKKLHSKNFDIIKLHSAEHEQ